jgi:hypothetical protein
MDDWDHLLGSRWVQALPKCWCAEHVQFCTPQCASFDSRVCQPSQVDDGAEAQTLEQLQPVYKTYGLL